MGLYLTMTALTIFFPIFLALVGGNPDWGPIWSGYLGLVLMGAAFLSVGLFASSLTSNQMVSAMIAFVILLVLFIMSQVAQNVSTNVGEFLGKLSLADRFEPYPRGIVDLKDTIFYITFTAVLLFLTIQVVEARRYRA
jgi:ABC-2 type transport system permease protein